MHAIITNRFSLSVARIKHKQKCVNTSFVDGFSSSVCCEASQMKGEIKTYLPKGRRRAWRDECFVHDGGLYFSNAFCCDSCAKTYFEYFSRECCVWVDDKEASDTLRNLLITQSAKKVSFGDGNRACGPCPVSTINISVYELLFATRWQVYIAHIRPVVFIS